MRNTQKCLQCGTENPIYKLTCNNCKAVLHNKVVNIDLWKTSWALLESPSITYLNLIQSEHKNFLILLILGLSLRLFSLMLVARNALLLNNISIQDNSISNFLIITSGIIVYIFAFSSAVKYLNTLLKTSTRIKDIFTIIIYSFLPQLIIFPLLYIIEYALFGENWFSFNPSPFDIKPTIAYMIFFIEGLLIIFSVVQLFLAINTLTKLKVYSFAICILFYAGLILFILFLPLIPFN